MNPPLQRVLIVEDDAMVRRLLARHFQKGGAAIVEAADVDQALAVFREPGSRFDVVVTDVHLPGQSGLDLATEMRMLQPQQPIVFVTGDVDEKLAQRALAGGKAGYLLKPFEFFELDAAIAQAIQSATSFTPSAGSVPANASEDRWLAEQRRLLLAASQKPIDVGSFAKPDYKRRAHVGLWAKIAVTVAILVGFALWIGYGISSEEELPPQQGAPQVEQEGRTIYVPYEPPARGSQDPRRR